VAAALEVKSLEVVYQGVIQALSNFSLNVPEGSIVALLGANGAGKTTALKAISNFLPLENGRVTRGSITVGGQDLLGLPPHTIVRRGIFHVREGRHVFAEMSVEENLVAATFAQRNARPRKAALSEVYAYFPILAERRRRSAGYLSGGEQQMLAIGRALVADPAMILLDEPSLGLAPLIVKDIFAIIERINREKRVSILLVEQNAMIALKYASYGYVLENGRTVLEGTSEELISNRDVQNFYLTAA
jgi:branched-chain amino acid transport system ATP-binding protein